LKWGTFGSGAGQFNGPQGIATDRLGNVYVTDSQRIQEFRPDGTFVASWGARGVGDGRFTATNGIAADFRGCIEGSGGRSPACVRKSCRACELVVLPGFPLVPCRRLK